MVEKIKALVAAEPVRVRVYSVVVLVAGYLLVRGVVQPTDVDFVGSLAALVLGVEASRAKVTPSADVEFYDAEEDDEEE
jgi:hypothetical protein